MNVNGMERERKKVASSGTKQKSAFWILPCFSLCNGGAFALAWI